VEVEMDEFESGGAWLDRVALKMKGGRMSVRSRDIVSSHTFPPPTSHPISNFPLSAVRTH